MKLAYVTTYDPADLHAWSGSGFRILTALQGSGLQIECVGPLVEKYALLTKAKKFFYAKALAKNYLRNREPIELKNYARQAEQRIRATACDAIFSPGTIPIAYLDADKPLFFWTDATFAGITDFYPEFSNLCRETIEQGRRMEQLALSKCTAAIYTSEWAANSALENYDVDPRKVKVVPFGANIDCARSEADIDAFARSKSFECCKLLLVGVDWIRKGGAKALEVATVLNARGLRTELHIVGCTPPQPLPDFAKTYGFISKSSEQGRALLDRLMQESHFLILPSIAECYGVVFAEASSFGLPSLATKVGGIPSCVRDGINGYTFALSAPAEDYADIVERTMRSKPLYEALAKSAFREYAARLNWESAGRQVREIIEAHCGGQPRVEQAVELVTD